MGASIVVFLTTGTETIPCPVCDGELKHYDRRCRRLIDQEGAKHTYRLRRLRCKECNRMHTELPDLIVPYKRHSAAVIVSVTEDKDTSVPYEERTRQKIRAWCKKVATHLRGVWQRLVASGFASPQIVPDFIHLVRVTVNSGYWHTHPFGHTSYAV